MIKRILAHLDNRQGAGQHPEHPPPAPPQRVLPALLDQAAGSPTRTDACHIGLGIETLALSQAGSDGQGPWDPHGAIATLPATGDTLDLHRTPPQLDQRFGRRPAPSRLADLK